MRISGWAARKKKKTRKRPEETINHREIRVCERRSKRKVEASNLNPKVAV
jgi:hypothetical protein